MTPETLSTFPVILDIPVLWSDEDSFAHVNNVTYFRWCDEGRVEYLRRIGLFPEMPPQGIGPIVASATCNYRFPLHYPDTIAIGTRVVRIGNSSIQMEHQIVSRASGKVAAEAKTTMVTVDYATGAPVRVPDAAREAIAELEGAGCATR